jgi:HSP20 family protein
MALKEKDMLDEMERLFYRLFAPKLPMGTATEPSWQPLTDICETKDAFLVRMELAGVKKEEVSIELEGDKLYIRGRRRECPAEQITSHHQMEISYGRFERVLLLRAAISRDAISASFEDGFLHITLPKASPGERVRKIAIVREEE